MYIVSDKEKLIKYQNTILFFAKNCKSSTVGKVKLAKLLYYTDFDHYEKHLESITGAEYYNQDLGPVADDFYFQLDKLHVCGIITITPKATPFEHDFELIESNVDPNLDVFTKEELETLTIESKRWYSTSGNKMSDQSHKETPWKITKKGEHVPLQLALHRNEKAFLASVK